jgi:hypothetical protein
LPCECVEAVGAAGDQNDLMATLGQFRAMASPIPDDAPVTRAARVVTGWW